ncbi:hypothetical protein KI387_013367, partial [Taxus chinensis]
VVLNLISNLEYPVWPAVKVRSVGGLSEANVFSCFSMKHKLLFWDRPERIGFQGSSKCVLCNLESERPDHTLLRCPVSWKYSGLQVFMHEKSNRHTGAFVFSLGNLFASIPFLFLIALSCSLVIYFLLGMRSAFGLFMYFMLNFFMCLLINEGLLMVVASMLPQLFKGIITVVFLQGIMTLVAGYFRLRDELPRPVWKYPISYLAFHTYAIEGLLENEYTGTSFAVGQIGSIPGDQAVHDSYNISSSRNGKWLNLLILAVIAVGYRIILFLSLHFE